MPVETKTIGTPSAVLKGKADMTKKGYTQEQLTKNANGRVVLKSRSDASTSRGENKALATWRQCVEETRQEGDSRIPAKGSDHHTRARELYDKKMGSTKEEKGGWFSL